MSFANKLTDWRDNFLKKHVQAIGEGGNFLSAESVVLFSGPADLGEDQNASPANLIPIGLIQSAQVSQGKQVQQLFEIGSRRPIMIPGRTQIQAQLSRVLFDGPSLMKTVYVTSDGSNLFIPAATTVDTDTDPRTGDELEAPTDPMGTTPEATGDFWVNLASSMFNKPIGLGFALYDMEKQSYGGFYLENCYIRSHSFGISSQQTVLAESISLIATSLRPLAAEWISAGNAKA